MFVACGIWCLADVSSVSPSSEQTSTIASAIFDHASGIVSAIFDHASDLP